MSPESYVELIILSSDAGGTHTMNFVTVLFAYLVAIHFVGPTLSQVERAMATILFSAFSAFSAFPIGAAVSSVDTFVTLQEQFRIEHPEVAASYFPPNALGEPAPILFGTILLFAWLVGIVFTYTKKNTKSQGST